MGSNRLRSMVTSAAMAALALVLPVAFHATGLGSKFLPMLLPLLLNGFLVRFWWAAGTGFAVPWISAFATGMPPLFPPVAAVMSAECAVLGGVAALLHRRTGRRIWPALVAAIAAGRLTGFALTWAVASIYHLPPALTASAKLLEGLPGVVLQLAVVPAVVAMLRRRRGPLLDGEGA